VRTAPNRGAPACPAVAQDRMHRPYCLRKLIEALARDLFVYSGGAGLVSV
jgi:hypothetical protein